MKAAYSSGRTAGPFLRNEYAPAFLSIKGDGHVHRNARVRSETDSPPEMAEEKQLTEEYVRFLNSRLTLALYRMRVLGKE
jgi:hypothetical protein